MLGIPLQLWAAAGGIVLLGVLYEAFKQGGLSSLWSYVTTRTATPAVIAPPATATITDEQAIGAALLLARYKVSGKTSPAYDATMAAMKAALEVA